MLVFPDQSINQSLVVTGSEDLPGRADDAGLCSLVHAARGGHLGATRSLLAANWGRPEPQYSDVLGSSWGSEAGGERARSEGARSEQLMGAQVARREAEHQGLVAAAAQVSSQSALAANISANQR